MKSCNLIIWADERGQLKIKVNPPKNRIMIINKKQTKIIIKK